MEQKQISFYINYGNFKSLQSGVQFAEELVFLKQDEEIKGYEYEIFHIPTGLSFCTGDDLVELQNSALKLLEENREFITEKTNTVNLENLPLDEEFENNLMKLETMFGMSELPYQVMTYATRGIRLVDFVELEYRLMRKGWYNKELSIEENIKNHYGQCAIDLLDSVTKLEV